MRTLRRYSIESEHAERFFLNYTDTYGMHTVEISAEAGDNYEVFGQSGITYVLTWNASAPRAGLEAFVGSLKLGECFYHNQKNLEGTLGKKCLSQSPVTMAKRLVQCVQTLPSASDLLEERSRQQKKKGGRKR